MGYAARLMPTTSNDRVPEPAAAAGERILIIGDDAATQEELRDLLVPEGYQLNIVPDGTSGLEALRATRPAAIIVDVQWPAASQISLCQEIVGTGLGVPVVILSSNADLRDKIQLLELGADDFVTKPFSPPELLARVRALMRNFRKIRPREIFKFGEVEVIFREMKVKRNGTSIDLTSKEFQTLEFLIRNARRVVSRDELLNEVWGYENYPCTRTVDNHILRLRQKLERDPSDPRYLRTVHGAGYQFVP